MGSPPQDIWSDPSALAAYYVDHALPIRANPGVIVASIIVSILGSYTTLLLLGRRSGAIGRNIRSHILLALSAVCFGALGVWGMHFISFQAFRLAAGPNYRWVIRFSPGFTSLSLFVPMFAIWLAFWFLGSQDEFSYIRTSIAGVFVGLTIGLMHYSASFQLPYLVVSYKAYTVVVSILVAMLAATAALILFFRLRSQWQDSFWKRSLCAIALAVAVCGMHYIGVAGTSYSVKPGITPQQLRADEKQNIHLTIAIAVLFIVIAAISIAVAIIDHRYEREIRKKARMIVIASAAFDKQGKLLVRADGMLPMQVIETDAVLKDILEELDPRKPTFQWLYTLSFDWSILAPWLPRLRASIYRRKTMSDANKRKKAVKGSTTGRAEELFDFKNRFCEAACQLADELDLPLDKLGVMFDRVLTTGTRRARVEAAKDGNEKMQPIKLDDESSIHGITLNLPDSDGIMLVVVRELADSAEKHGEGLSEKVGLSSGSIPTTKDTDTVEKYTSRGYRLADIKFFSPVLSERVGVSKPEMDAFLGACKTYAKRGTRPVVQPGGVYLGLYGVRPNINDQSSSVDVLVYNFARHQIPAYRLPEVTYPVPSMLKSWIREASGMTLYELITSCNAAIAAAEEAEQSPSFDESDRDTQTELLLDYKTSLVIAAEALCQAMKVWPSLYTLARLSPEILELPSSTDGSTVPAQVIVLELILPAPTARLTPAVSRASMDPSEAGEIKAPKAQISDKPPQPFVFTPFSLFSIAQAQLLQGKASHAFARDVNAQFSKLFMAGPTDIMDEVQEAEMRRAAGMADPSGTMLGRSRRKALAQDGPNGFAPRNSSLRAKIYPQDFGLEHEEKDVFGGPAHASPTRSVSQSGRAGGLKRFLPRDAAGSLPLAVQTGAVHPDAITSSSHSHSGDEVDGSVSQPTSPAPAYSSMAAEGMRQHTGIAASDGWHIRSMRTLERSEGGERLAGAEW